jgi:hypothetical protein
MNQLVATYGYHGATDAAKAKWASTLHTDVKFTYDFRNFFHPYVGDLIEVLNRESLTGLFDPATQAMREDFFDATYTTHNGLVDVESHPKAIDVDDGGPYANYNWELLFHFPVAIAVHLSKTQRFAEAQRWFHYVFDPTSNDVSVPAPRRYWKFLRFRNDDTPYGIDDLLMLLSTPDAELDNEQKLAKTRVLEGYEMIRLHPFKPHTVARTRPLAYQYQVVMRYLDNLIAWGDQLFLQDTVESINEATQRYVLASNLLGPRPVRVPPSGTVRSRTFAQLRAQGLDEMGNALVELEGQFPFNLSSAASASGDGAAASTLFGIGRTLYFCVPANEQLLRYWDTVADRLYKIRHCMNIQGVVRQLALFDPPLDPGMLVKAAAAGIDIGSIVAGTNQPVGPLRAMPLIRRAAELAGEVRSLGNSLMAAIERRDSEHLALLRQGHEIQLQKLAQDVRFLQWKNAEQSTEALVRARASTWERYRYYLRLQGLAPDDALTPEFPQLDRRTLTEETFDEAFSALVEAYETPAPLQAFPALRLSGESAPANQSGAAGAGALHLTSSENAELNTHMTTARDLRLAASITDTVASVLTFIPEFNINLHFWGMGGSSTVFGGSKLSDATKIASEVMRTVSTYHSDQAGIAGRTAGHERRADDWILQANTTARELAHSGRQIIGSLIAEQVAFHEYTNAKAQLADSGEINDFLQAKFTNEELHTWMQGELSRLYYQWYRFAFDTARRAERTMKLELRRAELDEVDFVAFNYWDGGRKGLLSGDALQLDVKRMEMAYHDNNRRELELTRHVSLRQLDPLALLRLKATGKATFEIPEWLYDVHYPGHYMRRIKSVSLSVPSVVGPYTPLPCTLSLQRSSIRVSPLLADGVYARDGSEDDRFVDAFGPVESIVTSSAANDSGMFETPLNDERLLPFEGAGAISTWEASMPADLQSFDYASISDVIVHVRLTAREGGDVLGDQAVSELKDTVADIQTTDLALLLSLRHDFPTEWAAFTGGVGDLTITLSMRLFPYLVQERDVILDAALTLYAPSADKLVQRTVQTPAGAADALNDDAGEIDLTLAADANVLKRTARDVYLVVRFGFDDV